MGCCHPEKRIEGNEIYFFSKNGERISFHLYDR